MKFAKIPYQNSQGYRLINLDQISLIECNSKSNIFSVTLNNKEKITLVHAEALALAKAISDLNYMYKNYLALGLAEELEKADF